MKRFGTDWQHAIGIGSFAARRSIVSSTGYPQLIHRNGDCDRSNFNDICLAANHTSQILMWPVNDTALLFAGLDTNRSLVQIDLVLLPTVAADAGRRWAVGEHEGPPPSLTALGPAISHMEFDNSLAANLKASRGRCANPPSLGRANRRASRSPRARQRQEAARRRSM